MQGQFDNCLTHSTFPCQIDQIELIWQDQLSMSMHEIG